MFRLLLITRSLTRRPLRTLLGLVGTMAVGALLLNMLLLSNGLVLSFGSLLEDVGFEVRITATRALPTLGSPIRNYQSTTEELEQLPEIDHITALTVFSGFTRNATTLESYPTALLGVDGNPRSNWTVLEGSSLAESDFANPAILDEETAEGLGIKLGDAFEVLGNCDQQLTVPLPITFRLAGIATFAFAAPEQGAVAIRMKDIGEACGFSRAKQSDPPIEVLLVALTENTPPDQAVRAIRTARPDLYPFSNTDFLTQFRTGSYSYFEQVSRLLSVVTLGFSILLITTLLSVSVNQRLGEIAALRAIGLTKFRVLVNVICEGWLMTIMGAVLAFPLGALMAWWLNSILKNFPGLPSRLDFFVWDSQAVLLFIGLMMLSALLSVIYPAWIIWKLPVANTLREEIWV